MSGKLSWGAIARWAVLVAVCVFVGGRLLLTGSRMDGSMTDGSGISSAKSNMGDNSKSFGDVVQAVDPVAKLIVLTDPRNQAMIAVSPSLQGRVLTSTADGMKGRSFGWVNEPLIESRQVQQHFNPWGGEDRIWVGPEGGQFSVFFAPGARFDLEHWFTPAAVDTEPFAIVHQSSSSVVFRKEFTLRNYSRTEFHVQIDREIDLIPGESVWRDLRLSPIPGLRVVGFESKNKLTNIGKESWKKETGLLSIWILGQFQASPGSTIVIPIHEGDASKLGTQVTSDYFGPVPASRLSVRPNVIFFKADANYRAKLGINPLRAKGILGSYDAQNHVLTLVQYTMHEGNTEYVNSLWKIQDHPYGGDISNVYNDGPDAHGKPTLGHFYEMESSSPAAALTPGGSAEHVQRTFHFEGDEEQLDKLAHATLGVGLDVIQTALPQ